MTPAAAKRVRVSGPRGRRVKLQRLTDDGWRTRIVRRTNSERRVRVARPTRRDGTWRLRVPSTRQWRAKTSTAITTDLRTMSVPTDTSTTPTSVTEPTPTTTTVVGGVPGAANTGVPDGTPLRVLSSTNKPYPGDYISGLKFIVTTPGAVYDAWRFDYLVEVRVPGVTFRRSLFRGVTAEHGTAALLTVRNDTVSAGRPSAVVEDSSFIPSIPRSTVDGVRGSNITLRRVEITDTVDGVHIYGTTSRNDPYAGNVTIESSWIHDLPHYQDGSHSDGTHNDGVQIIGGRNIRIVGNRIDGTMHNAGIMITQGRNDVSDVTIANNRVAGGSCTVNVNDKNTSYPISGLTMTDNVFTRGSTRNTDCAMIVTNNTRAIATATNNTWHDDTTPPPYMRNGG